MVKIISGISVAILSVLFAGYFGYIYVTGQNEGHSPLLLIPSVFLVAVGVYAIFKVFRIITAPKTTGVDALALQSAPAVGDDPAKILKRNNQLIEDYTKTEKTQDQLKMLQAAGTVEEGNS